MSFPRYPEYKDSGVEWLGEVPAHWGVVKLGLLGVFKGGAGFPDEYQGKTDSEIPFFKVADISRSDADGALRTANHTISSDTAHLLRARVFPTATLIFAKVGAALLLQRYRWLGQPSCIDNNMMGLMVNERCMPRFLLHVLPLLDLSLIANPGAVPSINEEQISSQRVALPPLSEQVAVTAFLDRETAKIDALVAEQQRLIELLKEKRQAVISHAVTKGLNPDASMKPSGVEWLGDVPAHWSVASVRRVVRQIEQGWSPDCFGRPAATDEWGVVKSGCVNRGVFIEQENKALPDALDPIPEYEIHAGDVLMSRASGSPELVGSTAYITRTRPRLMLSDKIFRIYPEPGIDREFFVLVFNSRAMRAQIERAISGADGLANNLPQSALKGFYCVIPPLSEQKAIVSCLSLEIAKIDTLTVEAQRAIELLQERRTALISAAVTGQSDVRAIAERAAA